MFINNIHDGRWYITGSPESFELIPDIYAIEWEFRCETRIPYMHEDTLAMTLEDQPWISSRSLRGQLWSADPFLAGGHKIPGNGQPTTTGLADLVKAIQDFPYLTLEVRWINWNGVLRKITFAEIFFCASTAGSAWMETQMEDGALPPLFAIGFKTVMPFDGEFSNFIIHEAG